jgi:hypothetical protein
MIDFGVDTSFIGMTCSSANVKMSCEDARTLGNPGKRNPAEETQESKGLFGLPAPARPQCATVQKLN